VYGRLGSASLDPRLQPEKPLPIRVLMTTDTIGGVWSYSITLIKALACCGVDFLLATMGRPLSRDQRIQAQRIPNLHLAQSDFKLEWMDDPWADVDCAGEWLLQLAAQWQPTLVHLNGYSHAALPWHLPILVVAHSCVLSWWDAVRGTPLPAQWLTYAGRVGQGLRSAMTVIAPSASMLAGLRRFYDWDGDGMVIWNGLEPSEARAFRKEPLVFTAGRLWDEAKNLAALEAVASELRWPVYVAGEGELSTAKAPLTRLGYLSQPEISNWMRRASIYALPARYEPFGLSILEAALSECALVLGDVSSLRELWNGAAWFVAPDDTTELSHALATLIAQASLRQQFAERASERARCYGLKPMAHQYLAVYQKLLEASARCV
jgi:glycosyltransferase involved in cell wall biosynthesis